MVINTNVSAMTSGRLLSDSTSQLAKSLARLSSGSRIVSPEDDSAGLAQSIKFDAQIHRNTAAISNITNAISYVQTQDGELKKLQKAVDRFSELAVLAMDETKSSDDVLLYNLEANQTLGHVMNSLGRTFNGIPLFLSDTAATVNGVDLLGPDLEVTVDSEGNKFQMPKINLLAALGPSIIGPGAPVGNAQDVIYAKEAVEAVATMRAKVGASLSRLQMESETLSILNENMAAANSRIKDTDVAEESTIFARTNILTQSGTAMLAQANVMPQAVLRLLG